MRLTSSLLLPLLSTSVPISVHFALYKPDGILSQFVNNGKLKRHQKMLPALPSVHRLDCAKLMACGRLDEMSEGLILLTTCGKMSRAVTYGLGEERKKISKEVRNNVSASSTTVPRLTSMRLASLVAVLG